MKKADKIDALKRLRVRVKGCDFLGGLCSEILYSHLYLEKITAKQKKYLQSLIPKKRPYNGYCWEIGAKSPRIKFINEHLKRLEKK